MGERHNAALKARMLCPEKTTAIVSVGIHDCLYVHWILSEQAKEHRASLLHDIKKKRKNPVPVSRNVNRAAPVGMYMYASPSPVRLAKSESAAGSHAGTAAKMVGLRPCRELSQYRAGHACLACDRNTLMVSPGTPPHRNTSNGHMHR